MFVEEIIAKRNGKEYRTFLVRESFRNGLRVSHRTVANISHLPKGCIDEIKRYFKGNLGGLDLSQVQVINSKEYGACQVALLCARSLELDSIIFPKKIQWREDVMAMIVGRLIYRGYEISLIDKPVESVLWDFCGHVTSSQYCYDSLDQLSCREINIEEKLKLIHTKQEFPTLLFLAHTHVEKEKTDGFSSEYKGKCLQTEFTTALLTNIDGCPLGVQIHALKHDGQKQAQKKIIGQFNLNSLILIGEQEILERFDLEGLITITELSRIQVNELIEKENVSFNMFLAGQFYEVIDLNNPAMRYVLGLDLDTKKEQTRLRNERIKKTETLLNKIKKLSRISASTIEDILAVYEAKALFEWKIEKGKLFYSKNEAQISKERNLDGCYVIRTNAKSDLITTLDVIVKYQQLNEVQDSFGEIKTLSSHLSLISSRNRVKGHVLLCLLSHYLKWHMDRKLEFVFKASAPNVRRWTLSEVIHSLKTIRSQTLQIGNMTLKNVITTLDSEQNEMIAALGVSLAIALK